MPLVPTPDTIRINSAVYAYNSCATFVDNIPFQGILEVSYDHGIESEKVWAQTRAGAPIGRTDGKYDANLKITMLRDSWTILLKWLSTKGLQQGGAGFGRVAFTLVFQISHPQIGRQTIEFVDCRIQKHSEPNQVGTAPLQTELEISVMDILLDNKSMHAPGLVAVLL